MCNRCVTRAESAILFREQCRAANEALHQAALQVFKMATNVAPFLPHSLHTESHSTSGTNSQNTRKFSDCDQNYYLNNRLHMHYPYYPKESETVHHMHIVEPSTSYSNFNQCSSQSLNYDHFVEKLSRIRQNHLYSSLQDNSATESASCALHCSDKSQLTNSDNNLDLSCDEINVDVEETSNPLDKSLEYQNYSNYLNYSDCLDNITPEPQKSNDHQTEISEPKKKIFRCIECDKSYSSKSKLGAHMKLHSKKNIHQCRVCKKIFSYSSYLVEHMKKHNPASGQTKELHECSQCQKKFQFIKSYKRHLKLHSSKDLFHCDICDKIFTHKYPLKVHIMSHRGIKSHKCDKCNKSFTQKSNLIEHLRTHSKVKPFRCKLCEKTFTQSSHLKTHEMSHSSQRQHLCRICGKSFKLANHLKRHYNSHTGLKVYRCHQCNQVFSQAYGLKRHSKKHLET